VATLVKEDKHKGDTNITQREIDLAYGLKNKQENIFTHTIKFFLILYLCIWRVFLLSCIISKYKYVYQLSMHFLCVWHILVETPQGYVVQCLQISHQKVG
jgi:hypothetical protein